MYRKSIFIGLLTLLLLLPSLGQDLQLNTSNNSNYPLEIGLNGKTFISSPDEGLWSIAIGWKNDWPTAWKHAKPTEKVKSGDWEVLKGELKLPQGKWILRDAYKHEKGMIKCIRRFEWKGKEVLNNVTLSVRYKVEGEKALPFLPGIMYYGNPSGEKNGPHRVPYYHGEDGDMAIFEDHRYPMPFATLEFNNKKKYYGATIHTIPSPVKGGVKADHWWSMGVKAFNGYSELLLLSGPVSYNGKHSVAKALQHKSMKYTDTYMNVKPGTIIEKTYYLDIHKANGKGTAFQKPVYKSIELFKPFYTEDLPSYNEIISQKYQFAKSRWIEGDNYAGFNMYPSFAEPRIVMGWCGQAASLGFALQNLKSKLNDPGIDKMIQKSLDHVASCPVGTENFPVRYSLKKSEWSSPDNVSQGQGMYNVAKAIQTAKNSNKFNTSKWEEFLKKASDVHAKRILDKKWYPRSTAEGFYIAPLAIAAQIFNSKTYKKAALKAANHFAKRHITMEEPYWGGTLDARGEDKEGAWAAFQGFMEVYELTKKNKYLNYAKHACDVCLSYLVVWDIPLPPGRMADHNFKTRGWTVVSPQNQHIDVYGVLYSPEVYKMGMLLKNEDLKRVARVMYRSCGQLIDPFGSQGEQLQQTNFAQHGDMSDVYRLRGGYSEPWTVFWITAHFLNAAARFEEMGVKNL